MASPEGWHGWDDYAAFYDWENARTFGRRDVAFWQRIAAEASKPVLELGCGTGRLLVPMARTGARVIGIDRSAGMLAYARQRSRRLPVAHRPAIVRGDIRALPFRRGTFGTVVAAYGLIQSLLSDRDLDDVLSEVGRVIGRGGLVGLDLVPDLPSWDEYRKQLRFQGRSKNGGEIVLVETVRQDRRRGLTTFDEEFTERRGRHAETRRFALTFRTVSVPDLVERLARFRLRVESVAGDYRGGVWHPDAGTWLVLARKR